MHPPPDMTPFTIPERRLPFDTLVDDEEAPLTERTEAPDWSTFPTSETRIGIAGPARRPR